MYCYSRTWKAFRLVDQGPFHHLLKFCHPSLTEKDIPHWKTVQAEILQYANVAKEKVCKKVTMSHPSTCEGAMNVKNDKIDYLLFVEY